MVKRFKMIALISCAVFSLSAVFSSCGIAKTSVQKDNSATLTYYHISPLTESFKTALQKNTGIKLNFVCVQDHGDDTLDLLLSSSSLPDIIEYNWDDYKYSPQWLVDYGYLYELNPLIEEYSPNFKKYLEENPTIAKQIQSTRGKYYSYPLIRCDSSLRTGLSGLIIREDWLKDLGLSVPVTIEDFEKVLLAFKHEKNAVYPFVDHAAYDSILSAFGIKHGFYINKEGKVCYGPSDAVFKDALTLLRRWYELGLINTDGRMSYNIVSQYLINGKSGMAFGYAGSLLDTVNEALKKENSMFRFCGISNPVLSASDAPISFAGEKAFTSSAAITTSCEFPELAAQLLDYGYSREGQLFYNFGTEDDDFDKITDSDNLNYDYIRSYSTGPFLQLPEYYEAYLRSDILKEASKTWKLNCRSDMTLPVLQFTNEEHKEAVSIEKEITTYVNEMFFKFIIGAEELSSFDSYIKSLEQMQLDRLLEIYNTAYARYLNILQ